MAYTTKWMQERKSPSWQSLIGEFGEDVAAKMYGRMTPRAHDYISAQSGSLSSAFLTQARAWAMENPVISPLMGAEPTDALRTEVSRLLDEAGGKQGSSLPPDPGRGSMEFMLRQVGAGRPQAEITQMQSMEDVVFMGMGWGFSRAEIETQLTQKPGGTGSPSDAGAWLWRRYTAEYGGPPPKIAGQEGHYPAHAWRQTPGARQARARAEMTGYTGKEYKPEEWEYPYVRRQGQAVPWSIEAVTGTWPGVPGEESGTYMTGRGASEAQQLKVAKDIQRGGVYPEIGLRRGEESIMERAAFTMGPLSQRLERGFTAPMALLGQEWLPEGMMMLPEGHYTEGTFRFSKDIFLPKGFEPKMVEEGTKWTGGKVRPFEGAAPMDLGLGRAWSSVTMHSQSIAPGKKWSAKKQEWQEGQFLRMGFEVAATPEMLRLSSKTFGAKYMAPMGEAERMHGILGHGVSEVKDPTMLPVMWWAHRPEEAAAALSEMRGTAVTTEQLEQMNWAEVGGDLTKYFRERVMPEIYREKALEFEVHREMLPMFPEGRFTTSAIKGQPEMARVTTDPVPMLVGEWSMMGRRGWPVKQPNIPFREMQMIEDVAQAAGAQELVWDIQKQARPTKEAYSELISATMASKAKDYSWPGMTKEPVAIDPASARAAVARSHLAFEEKYGGKMPTDIPEGMMILNRMLMQEAETTWGSAISLGEAGVLASPKTAGYFSAQGAMEGSAVTGYISAYAGAIRATAEGTPEEQSAAYERAVTQQANIAGGRKVLRRAMQYDVPRALGDVLYPETALGAGEIAIPEEKVLRAYGVSREQREAFVGRWKAGKLTPTALTWGHPTTGREMFARQVAIVHPEVVAERGGMLGEETPFQASPMLAEMAGRDFDEDYLWGLMTGHLTGSGETLGVKSPGIPMATAEWVRSQASIVKGLGRASLAPGGGLKRPPGMSEGEWEKLGGLERFQASIDPRYLRAVGPKDQFEAQRALARRQEAIGVRYNILDDIVATATGRGAAGEAEHLHLAVHGRGQTPALLTPQLEKLMNYLETYTAKGGLYRRFAKPEEEGEFGAGSYAGGRGASRLMSGLMHAGLGAVTEESITPEIFGSLFYPEGREKEGTELAQRWAKAPAGSGARGRLSVELAELEPEEWIRKSVIGTVGGAHMMKRAHAKGIPSRLSTETEEYLEPWKQRYAMMRAFRSKRGEIPLEERVKAAVSLHPSQEAWFGEFGAYQAGTLSSHSGQALVGEEGPEVVDLPEGAVVHPATSSESQDAITARAVETGQMQRFQGGGVTGPADPWGTDLWEGVNLEEAGREFTVPRAPAPSRQETVAPQSQEAEEEWRPQYPPKVGAERFQRSLDLYVENIDKWSAQVEAAGGTTEEFGTDLSALTGMVLSWKSDIEKGTEYTWSGKEMQKVVRAARGLAEPGAGAGPWQALGGIQAEQQQAAFNARLEAAQGGGPGGPWGGPTTGIGWVGMRAAGWAGGEAAAETARGAFYLPQLAERLGDLGVPGVGALGGMAGMGIGAAIGLGRWGAQATMPGDPQVQAATWQQMQAAQYEGAPGVAAQAGLGLRAAGLALFHAPTVQRYGEARGIFADEVPEGWGWEAGEGGGMRDAAEALLREEGRAAGVQAWMSTAGAGGMQTAEMLAQRAAQPGMTTFQQMQMQEFVTPFTRGSPVAWAEYAQQGAPTTGWESTMGVQAQGMPAGMPTPQVEQVTRGGVTAWLQKGTQESWDLQEEERQLRIEQQEFQLEQTGERLGERLFVTGATRIIQDVERAASRGFQRTQFDWQTEDITRQWERGGDRLGWAGEDLERRRERAATGTEYQQQMLTYRYGMQQAQFGWAEQDLQRGFGRQQTQFGWQAEDLAFRGAQTTMQFGWQMEDIDESLRYATGRERRQLLRQRERATVSFGAGMGQLETQEGRLEERREWGKEDFETEKQRLGQRRTWAQDLYDMQMGHLRKTKTWNQDDYEREKGRLAQRRSWLDEDYTRETERHGVRVGYWEGQIIFEDQLRELTQAAEDKEIERQTAALTFATDYLTKQTAIQTTMTGIQKNQAVAMAAWSQFFETNGVFRTAFHNAILAVLSSYTGGGYSGTMQGNPYTSPNYPEE